MNTSNFREPNTYFIKKMETLYYQRKKSQCLNCKTTILEYIYIYTIQVVEEQLLINNRCKIYRIIINILKANARAQVS